MGRVLRTGLRDQISTLRLMTRKPLNDLHANEENVLADLGDREAVGRALEDVQAVIHLAGLPDEAAFEDILDSNIAGTYNLYESAREQGVKRIVFASTNHTIGFYPRATQLRPEDPPRPDTYYGVSKVFGEALARLYWDKWGIESACLRIGSFREYPEDHRQLSTWLSHHDGIELVRRCLEAPDIGFATIFGVSANQRSWWDIGDDARRIGFKPKDDAEWYANSIHVTHSQVDEQEEPSSQLQGGAYVASDYTGGSWPPRPVVCQSAVEDK
jgi:uronate dehydrogenase